MVKLSEISIVRVISMVSMVSLISKISMISLIINISGSKVSAGRLQPCDKMVILAILLTCSREMMMINENYQLSNNVR